MSETRTMTAGGLANQSEWAYSPVWEGVAEGRILLRVRASLYHVFIQAHVRTDEQGVWFRTAHGSNIVRTPDTPVDVIDIAALQTERDTLATSLEQARREIDALKVALDVTEQAHDFVLRYLPGQKVRVWIDEPEASEYAHLHGQVVTLDIYIEPNSDEPVWRCKTEDGAYADLFWHEIQPLGGSGNG